MFSNFRARCERRDPGPSKASEPTGEDHERYGRANLRSGGTILFGGERGPCSSGCRNEFERAEYSEGDNRVHGQFRHEWGGGKTCDSEMEPGPGWRGSAWGAASLYGDWGRPLGNGEVFA